MHVAAEKKRLLWVRFRRAITYHPDDARHHRDTASVERFINALSLSLSLQRLRMCVDIYAVAAEGFFSSLRVFCSATYD